MLLLYEGSVLAVRMVEKRREAAKTAAAGSSGQSST
jgi:Sec-independent protein secretion pathway component TatC